MPLCSKSNTHRVLPKPLLPSPSASSLVGKPSSFGGKICSGGFWNVLLLNKRFFFFFSLVTAIRYFVSQLCFKSVKNQLKKKHYTWGNAGILGLMWNNYSRLERTLIKKAKYNIDCLFTAWKQGSSLLLLDPELFPIRFPHDYSAAETQNQGEQDTGSRESTQYGMLSFHVAFSLCCESSNPERVFQHTAEITSACGVTPWCVLICKQ